jgi:hypothetical protein
VCSGCRQQWKALGYRVAAELSDPALGMIEESNGAELRLAAHVKPVLRAGWNIDQVAGLAQHLENLLPQVKAEQTPAFHKETHFVFAVGVLGQERLAEGCTIGVIRHQPDGIHGGVRPAGLHAGDLGGIGHQDLLRCGAGWQFGPGGPALEADAALRQFGGDQGWIVAGQAGHWPVGAGGREDLQVAHPWAALGAPA